ncbi:hypothetical protein LIER_06464 [Lithospermum erythrorhizon]|uniref:Uncharacterized protein n=1 Tax=Lithospermum erythrorhizon TaxID=34254 RepID=A0AAV3P4L8_LITER
MSSEVKEGKIEYLTPLNASAGNVFMEIEDKRMLPRPPSQKSPQNKRDMIKYCQYHKDHGHDTDDYRHLKIEIKKLFQQGQPREYVHKDTQSVNRHFDRDRSSCPDGPPSITGRANVISGGKSGGGDSGSAIWRIQKRSSMW